MAEREREQERELERELEREREREREQEQEQERELEREQERELERDREREREREHLIAERMTMPMPIEGQDCLIVMLEQVRQQRPPVFMADEYANWLCAIGDCIAALPTQDQRWAAGVLVANDLVLAMPGLSLAMAHLSILEAVMKATR